MLHVAEVSSGGVQRTRVASTVIAAANYGADRTQLLYMALLSKVVVIRCTRLPPELAAVGFRHGPGQWKKLEVVGNDTCCLDGPHGEVCWLAQENVVVFFGVPFWHGLGQVKELRVVVNFYECRLDGPRGEASSRAEFQSLPNLTADCSWTSYVLGVS